jgi:hypothetical protein
MVNKPGPPPFVPGKSREARKLERQE